MTWPRRTAASPSSATRSASSHTGPFQLPSSTPAALWKPVCTSPGHSAVALTPVPARSEASPSVKLSTQALWAA